MKELIVVLLLIFGFETGAWAFQGVPIKHVQLNQYKLVDFVPSQNGLSELQLPLNVMAASPSIEVVRKSTADGLLCSSTVISDSGHILLGGHCLASCLESAEALEVRDGIGYLNYGRLKSLSCDINLNGKEVSAQVLAFSPCIQTKERTVDGASSEKCRNLDYAILSFEKTQRQETPCLRVSTKVSKSGDLIATIGYPPITHRKASRRSARDSDGKTQQLTIGNVLAFQNRCYNNVDKDGPLAGLVKPGDIDFNYPERAKKIENGVRVGRLIQTTADILPGMSGGGLIDVKSGAVVGVAQFQIGNDEIVHCVGSGFFGSTAEIVKDLKLNFPDVDLNEVLKCEKNSVVSSPEYLFERSATENSSAPEGRR